MATTLNVSLDRDGSAALSVQLADAIRATAAAGRLRRGDRLPSTRALATSLGVSRTVTASAYEQLQAEGWIEGRTGAGTYVASDAPAAILTGAGLDRPGRILGPDAGPGLVDLRSGAPWIEGIDRPTWRRAWRAAGHIRPTARREPAGTDAFRIAVAEHLLRHRGLLVDDPLAPDGILATAGTTAAAAELATAALCRGDAVAIEEPGYGRARDTLRAAGLELVPVAVDGQGLIPEAIPARVRAVYCSPAHQYPLGARMPAARRVELVARARRHGWLIIEDDYDGELRYDASPPPLLAVLARDVVIHLGTTSKILSPALGCGWMVAPEHIAEKVLEQRRTTIAGPSDAGQHVLVELARAGDLGRHLRRLRRELSLRRAMLVDTFAALGIEVLGDDAGAHVVVPLEDSGLPERDAVRAALDRGLTVDSLARHFAGTPTRTGLVVGYTTCSREELASAALVLSAVLGRHPDSG